MTRRCRLPLHVADLQAERTVMNPSNLRYGAPGSTRVPGGCRRRGEPQVRHSNCTLAPTSGRGPQAPGRYLWATCICSAGVASIATSTPESLFSSSLMWAATASARHARGRGSAASREDLTRRAPPIFSAPFCLFLLSHRLARFRFRLCFVSFVGLVKAGGCDTWNLRRRALPLDTEDAASRCCRGRRRILLSGEQPAKLLRPLGAAG